MEFSRSFRLSRSQHILLTSESVSSECAKIAGYERLSQSMRVAAGEYDFFSDRRQRKHHKRGSSSMGFILGKFFFFNRTTSSSTHEGHNVVETTTLKKHKKKSSWLPDPDKRWPIQGW